LITLIFTDSELQVLLQAIHDDDTAAILSQKINTYKNKLNKEKERLLNKEELSREFLILSANKLRNKFVACTTESEEIFKGLLEDMHIDFKFQEIFYLNKKEYYIADFYLPDYDSIFEIGCFKDKHGDTRVMDPKRVAKLRDIGIVNIYRLDRSDLEGNSDLQLLSSLVKELLLLEE
jgi:hypothetical protein